MKKKLEAELISIAHRILKLKNKSELVQLHQETQKLYEKLSVLKFVEENFGEAKPTIGYKEVEDKLEETFEEREPEVAVEAKTEETAPEVEKEVAEAGLEKEAIEDEIAEEEPAVFENEEEISIEEEEEAIDEEVSADELPAAEPEDQTETTAEKEEPLFAPAFELAFDAKEDVEEVAKESGHQIIFEDFLGDDYKELEFVKAEIEHKNEDPEPVDAVVVEEIEETKDEIKEPVEKKFPEAPQYDGPKVTKGITFGLNDRVGFVSQLFGGSNEDFNRVISQLNTFNTLQDATNFIEDLVKPDYNDWKGKEDFETRFMEVIEQKFK